MKRKSIKFQMITPAFMLTLFAIASPTLITSNLFIKNVEKQNEKQAIEAFRLAESRILALLSDTSDSALNLCLNEYISDYLSKNYSTAYDEAISRLLFTQEVEKALKTSSSLASVLFIHENGEVSGCSKNAHYFTATNNYNFFKQIEFFQLDFNTKWIGFVNGYDLIPLNTQTTADDYMICGIKKHVHTASNASDYHTLYILFGINEASLLSCFSSLEYDGGSVFLLDEYGRLVSGNYPVGDVPELYNDIGENISGNFMFQDSDHNQSQIIYYKINSIGWTLIKKIPKAIYTAPVMSMWQIAFLIGSVTFLLISILYSIWARNFCLPITKLTASIHELKIGDLTSRVPLANNYSSEMYLVCEQFNELLDNVNQLLVQKEWDERERATLEIKTLQSQITPHFIYNTLTSIRYMASISGASDVEQALITFSNIIKPIFSTWQSSWQLQEELKFIENYISLMRMRFGNLINIEIDTDEKTNICRLPRFVLQTLLENCCEHGFEGDRKLNIKLTTQIKENILYINVKDDGVGISEEKLSEIQYNIRHSIFGSSIGLTNLDRRIKLFCGDEFGLDIKSTYNKGTEITVRIRIII